MSRLTAILIAAVIFTISMFLPIGDAQLRAGLAILLTAAFLWMTEGLPLPITALLIPLLAVFTGVLQPLDAFTNFAHSIIFLFFGGFVLAAALSKFQLDKWVVFRAAGFSGGRFLNTAILMMVATSFLSMWVSNTSVAAMMLPLGLGLLTLAGKPHSSPESKFLLLGIAYAANIGGIVTLIGSPPNAIGAEVLGLSFVEWLRYGIPVYLVTFPIMILVLYFFFKPDKNLRTEEIDDFPLPSGSKVRVLLVIFLSIVALWLLEDVLNDYLPIPSSFNTLVILGGVILMVVFGLIEWKEIERGVDWGVLILFGGGLTLGMVLDKSGFGNYVAENLASLTGDIPMFFFILIIVALSIVFTEFMSNTASAALFVPLLYAMAVKLDIPPALLVIPATIAATYGFMLPIGTPSNALVFGTGLIRQKDMLRAGLILNMLYALILTALIYLLV